MATECGGVNIRARAFENEVLIVEYDIQMRSILLGVERNPCHVIQLIDLRYRFNRLYIYSAAVVARKYIRYIYKIKSRVRTVGPRKRILSFHIPELRKKTYY